MIKKFRKKPVVIEAVKWDGERYYIFYDLIRQNEIKKGIYKK